MPSNNANAQMKVKQLKNKNAGIPNKQGVPKKEVDPVEEARIQKEKKEKGRLIAMQNERKGNQNKKKQEKVNNGVFLEESLRDLARNGFQLKMK
jgi:hypothetical protein